MSNNPLEEAMPYLKKIDHVAYAVAKGNIRKWTWFHTEVEGGKLIKKIDDAIPHGASSMKIWCIDYGEFGIALIEGIDRGEKSQVTNFVERHGDHSCQHIAYDCHDLDCFLDHLRSVGGATRGEILVQNDGFGQLKQIFAKGYVDGHAGESQFSEYCERPKSDEKSTEEVNITFSEKAGQTFYEQVQDAIKVGDHSSLLNFDHMPLDWEPEVTFSG